MSSNEDLNAQIAETNETTLINNQYLSFLLGNEPFAIPVTRILEIIEYDQVTIVPTAPERYRGVVNLRGKIIPVIELTKVFGLEDSEITKRTCIIIMEVSLDNETIMIGCMVDKVLIVQEIEDDAIEETPALGTIIAANYVKGLSNIDDRFFTILDTDTLFSAQELIIGYDAGLSQSTFTSTEATH
ncbi:MAG: chemotaxis protein CheW [Gammaproteobacteria bacterium]|nr:MAG: chemotaxis protein CheW [Gammaproteobacteria bacterium]